MRFDLFRNKMFNKIEIIGREVQSLVNIEFERINNNPNEKSSLNQAGLKDGLEIINSYNVEGEYGGAFEHILYMIDETRIIISESSSRLIIDLSDKMDISIDHIGNQLKN